MTTEFKAGDRVVMTKEARNNRYHDPGRGTVVSHAHNAIKIKLDRGGRVGTYSPNFWRRLDQDK